MRVYLHIFEMIAGAVLLGMGLLYLSSQYRIMDRLSETVKKEIIQEEDIYQQYHDIHLNQVSKEELYALIMGYREYPIVIDGTAIYPDDMENEAYIPLIKDGQYKKEYVYDANHNITKIVFSYTAM